MLGYLGALRSDFSAFHRVPDVREMDAETFFVFADNIVYYKGALRGIAEKQQEEKRRGHTFQSDSETRTTSDQWAMNRSKKIEKPAKDNSIGQPSGEVDAALNPALTSVQPGEKMPFLEKGSPDK